MAINLTPGEIYFIREKDLLTKEVSSYVKVGLVREGEDRGSEERASEHQTGNPRQLFVEKIVKTEAVSAVENMLHDHFANQRVSGEWFDFDNVQLQECIHPTNPPSDVPYASLPVREVLKIICCVCLIKLSLCQELPCLHIPLYQERDFLYLIFF